MDFSQESEAVVIAFWRILGQKQINSYCVILMASRENAFLCFVVGTLQEVGTILRGANARHLCEVG